MMERNNAIAQLKEIDPTYIPPSGFQFKNAKLEDKVMLPAEVRIYAALGQFISGLLGTTIAIF